MKSKWLQKASTADITPKTTPNPTPFVNEEFYFEQKSIQKIINNFGQEG